MATAYSPAPSSLPAAATSSRVESDETRRRLILSLSGEMSDRIDKLSARTGYDTGELLDIAFALLTLSLEAIDQGKQVGIAAEGQDLERSFTGFHKNDPAD